MIEILSHAKVRKKQKAIKSFKIVHFYWLFSSDIEAVSRERVKS